MRESSLFDIALDKDKWDSQNTQDNLKNLDLKENKYSKPNEVKLSTRSQEICKLFSNALTTFDQQVSKLPHKVNDLYVDKLIEEFLKLSPIEKDKVREIINQISEQEFNFSANKIFRKP